ncbi:MAG: tRNA 2-selenouridine(34) synthase MnmH [Bacteroidetes bacterium]|nr:MAG: tRNA 2-selenouridine(34) synthase MnmH [Bacteroidota bacterium]
MALEKIDVVKFLEHAEVTPVVDVRSPSEYNSGHIPGSINLPLFDDIERAIVGTRYKKEGRIPAILEGLKLTAPVMTTKLEKALSISKNGELLVHCWRGGMRSEAMAWLFSLGDIKTEVLEGGYKSYRHYILESLSQKKKMIILGGMTGSSKTHLLRFLKGYGQQIIDLEGLANHKGSAFGSLGQLPQPSTEHFANLLFEEWKHINQDLPFWIEDESRNIGTVFMPDKFYSNMQHSPAIILMMNMKTRLPRLLEEYTNYPSEAIKASILRISKRLGGDNTREAIYAVEKGDFAKAIEITLFYYDKAYQFGLKKKSPENIFYVETDSDDIEINALKILDAARKIKWE